MNLGMCNIVYKNYYLLTVIEEIKAILVVFELFFDPLFLSGNINFDQLVTDSPFCIWKLDI